MSERNSASWGPKPYRRLLAVAVFLLLVLGGAIAVIGAYNAQAERESNDLLVRLGAARLENGPPGTAATAWMWFGITLAVVGWILLIVYVATGESRDTPAAQIWLRQSPEGARASFITGGMLLLFGEALTLANPVIGLTVAGLGVASIALGIARGRPVKAKPR